MSGIVVGVSGISATDNPGPGTGIARSLKEDRRLAARVVGLAYDALEPGIYMDWLFEGAFTLRYPSTDGPDFLKRVLEVMDATGLDFVIPNLDVELPLYIKYADELARHGIGTFLPTMRQFRLRGKDRLPEVSKAVDVRAPQTFVVSTEDALHDACRRIGFPVMVKGAYYQAFRAETAWQAAAHFRAIAAEWGYPVIVQQIVSGEEVNLVGVGDGCGGMLGYVAMKKVSFTSLGKVWAAVTLDNPPLADAARRFVSETHWRGPFELECMYDPDDERPFLIEINPRFPAWSYFATGVGVNLPSRMLRHARGEAVDTSSDYEAGKFFMRYTYEMVTDMQCFQNVILRGATP